MNLPEKIAALKQGDEFILAKIFLMNFITRFISIFSPKQNHLYWEEVTQLSFIKLWNYRKISGEELPLGSQLFQIAKQPVSTSWKEGNRKKLSAIKPETFWDQVTEDCNNRELQAKT